MNATPPRPPNPAHYGNADGSDGEDRGASAPDVKFALPGITPKEPRTIFVAYSYRIYSTLDYRAVYARLEKAMGIKFHFADEKVTTLHLLQKIAAMIRSSAISIFDVSGWNPNVTLELGMALGLGEPCYISYDPSKTPIDEVISDLGGMDRIQYSSLTEYEEKLGGLLASIFVPERAEDPMTGSMREISKILHDAPGLRVADLARASGYSKEYTQFVVRRMLADGLVESTGATRGTRYRIKEKPVEVH